MFGLFRLDYIGLVWIGYLPPTVKLILNVDRICPDNFTLRPPTTLLRVRISYQYCYFQLEE